LKDKDGESWVELFIPLMYFNGIDLTFLKVCGKGLQMPTHHAYRVPSTWFII
jgi:hypothetical protein